LVVCYASIILINFALVPSKKICYDFDLVMIVLELAFLSSGWAALQAMFNEINDQAMNHLS